MVNIITELVKYMNIIFIALYTFCALRVLVKRRRESQQRYYFIITLILYLIHGANFLVLIISTQKLETFIFYVVQLAVLLVFRGLYKSFYKRMSELVFCNMFAFIIIGLIMQTRLSFETAVHHFIYIVIGMAICLIVPVMIEKLKLFAHLGWIYMLGGITLLALLLVIGSEVYGATNWLVIGEFQFQPSELVKLLYVLGIAALLKKKQTLPVILVVSLLAAAHVLILVIEKDLGAALLFFVTYIVMLFGATGKLVYLISGITGGIAASFIAYQFFTHVQVRVAAFIDPMANYSKGGYQVAQSLFAIGSGGWFGSGLGSGYPNYVPVSKSDFIFSAISEEMGGIFGICLIMICISCFIMFVNITVKLQNQFYRLAALGFGVMYIVQVFLNIGGVIKFIPSTGVTLPLISTGGSSIITTILMFSIIQGMYVLKQRETEKQIAMDITEAPVISGASGERVPEVTDTAIPNEPKISRKSVYAVTYAICLLLLITIGYYSYFIQAKAPSFIDNAYNQRLNHMADNVIRGNILSADGRILAQTMNDSDGNEYRDYPFDELFSHVVGRNSYGMTGIERSENLTLLTSNINGVSMIIDEMTNIKSHGDDVVTTLNYELQKAAFKALGDRKGAVVVMEPSTGKILAMVSKPDYDPNKIEKNWNKLTEDEDSPLLNRAIQGLYPPGSTFKILTTIEYIREFPNYEDYVFGCEGKARANDVTINCAGNTEHGKENLKEAFANSCNSAFATMGVKLNMDDLHKLCDTFLFNGTLPGSFGASASRFVLDGQSDKNDIPQTVIGLGKTQITPLHNALIISTIANNGIMMEPYLVDKVVNSKGSVVKDYKPSAYGQIIPEEEAAIIRNYLEEAVKEGTAKKLAGKAYSSAGKTGTATYEKGKEPHAWYIGYAPADNPQIAVSIILESAGSGSSKAVPVAAEIFDKFFSLQNQ